MFFSVFIGSSCKNFLKVRLMMRSIKSNTACQYFPNLYIYIPIAQDILLFILVLCAIFLVFGATYAIELFANSLFCVSNICGYSFGTLPVWNGKIVFFRILQRWLSFSLQQNLSSFSFYPLPSRDAIVLNHHYELQYLLFLKIFARVNSYLILQLV